MRQEGGCAYRLARLAHSWARAFVSRVKKVGYWALFGEANKSQVNGPNRIENLSKASQSRAYSSSSKDNLGKRAVSRGWAQHFGRRAGMLPLRLNAARSLIVTCPKFPVILAVPRRLPCQTGTTFDTLRP
eukprot:scaffold215_cov389-Pavlova_lutheri.AAC.2